MKKVLEWNTISEELQMVDRYMREFLPSDETSHKTGEIIRTILAASGKRYRPQLLLLAARLGREYPLRRERLCKMGAMIELVHTASLIHDDIVDDSPMRRGCATVQSRFGKDMAVYAGDLILGKLMRILFEEQMPEFGSMLGATIEQMCRGEIGQSSCRYRTDTGIEQYYENIYGKTAALFVTACRAGGMEGGCSQETLEALGRFGEELGYLFQIRDDLLDFVSDETREGKPVHQDFREGVFTLPVLYALQNVRYSPTLRILAERAQEGSWTAAEDALLTRAVRDSGGLARTAEQMELHYGCALELLKHMPQQMAVRAFGEALRKLKLPQFLSTAAASS